MKLVIIESPFGTTPEGKPVTSEQYERNIGYAWEAVVDCLRRGEAPFASHLFYPGVLDDLNPDELEGRPVLYRSLRKWEVGS